MNSERVQPPEYVDKERRLIFNGIGEDASSFVIYPDGSPYPHMGNAPEPTYEYDPEGEQWPTHMAEYLDSVRTGAPTKCSIDQAFIEAATLLTSVESYNQKRQVRWDLAKEEIV